MRAEGGRRLAYDELPEHVRGWVERVVGSAPVEAVTQSGGISAGCALRMRLGDGRRLFLKAVARQVGQR